MVRECSLIITGRGGGGVSEILPLQKEGEEKVLTMPKGVARKVLTQELEVLAILIGLRAQKVSTL